MARRCAKDVYLGVPSTAALRGRLLSKPVFEVVKGDAVSVQRLDARLLGKRSQEARRKGESRGAIIHVGHIDASELSHSRAVYVSGKPPLSVL